MQTHQNTITYLKLLTGFLYVSVEINTHTFRLLINIPSILSMSKVIDRNDRNFTTCTCKKRKVKLTFTIDSEPVQTCASKINKITPFWWCNYLKSSKMVYLLSSVSYLRFSIY